VLRAERRRPADLAVAALIAVVVLVTAAIIALRSPVAHTTSVPVAGPPLVTPAEPVQVPARLRQVWERPNSASITPVVAGPVVITADGSTVTGRDPLTGDQRWLYQRNLPLCTVGAGWDLAIAVYRNGGYCGEVTSLHAATGTRGPLRNSDVPPGAHLLWDGTMVTATGWDHLETWRSDLVKTLEYGKLRADIEPGTQPRPNCRHLSEAVATGLVGVVERCPHEPGDRLTVLHPDDADSDAPDQEFSTILPATGASLVALSPDREAVLLPNPTRLSVRDDRGAEVASYPLDLPGPDLPRSGDPPAPSSVVRPATALSGPDRPARPESDADSVAATARVPGALLWWTGSSTIGLDESDLHPLWTLPGTLGPGTTLAGQTLVPAPGAELLVDPNNGAVLRSIPVDRSGYRGPVRTAALGPMLFEQRGPILVALE
jgi:hypothetical protein